jgi:hypothetical protein
MERGVESKENQMGEVAFLILTAFSGDENVARAHTRTIQTVHGVGAPHRCWGSKNGRGKSTSFRRFSFSLSSTLQASAGREIASVTTH